MSRSENPIGIFDSGIGGLTVANAVLKTLPSESFIYFGDTAHLPYGDKSPVTIQGYATGIANFLKDQNCKLIIIACNTASSVAYEHVQNICGDIPVVNVIDPVVDHIALKGYRKVGVIGTLGTIGSGVYYDRIKKKDASIKVYSLATPLLAPMVESGFIKGEISQLIIEKYLGNDILEDIEALILGCTHYPLIKTEIEQFYKGKKVEVLATNEIVGDYVRALLEREGLMNDSGTVDHKFYVSDYTGSFEQTTRLFYGEEIHLIHYPIRDNSRIG